MPKGKTNKAIPRHTHFAQGHKVLVKLKNGSRVVDTFIKRNRDTVALEILGNVKLSDIATLSEGLKHLKK